MLFRGISIGGVGGSGGGGGGSGAASMIKDMVVRHFSKKRAVNLRKINPKVPYLEASSIAQDVYQLLRQKGPLSVSNTWNQIQEAGIGGLNSKTHMKIMLKWMMGRKMLKLLVNHVGSSKKFLVSTLPEEPQSNPKAVKLETEKPSAKKPRQSQ